MGLYLRKSIKVGPLRFNLSKSGVGVSAGVRGFRVGTGPRGNYVHMGRGGLYYRVTIPASSSTSSAAPLASPVEPPPASTHEPLQEIDSAAATRIVDSSSAELLKEINAKRRRPRFWPLIVVSVAVVSFASLASGWRLWLTPGVLVVGAFLTYITYGRDLVAKTVVLFYDLEKEMEETYSILHGWARQMAACSRVWHIEASGRVIDRKYHAGADNIIRRSPTSIRAAEPPLLKTNVETIAIGVGSQTLHFFPDRVLVYDRVGVGAVSYGELMVTVAQTQFIENSAPPPDAQVVGYTWRYVNKTGGPDRRFKDNRQLPICVYDEVAFKSQSGLKEVIQVSRTGVADGFAQAIQYLGQVLPPERARPAV